MQQSSELGYKKNIKDVVFPESLEINGVWWRFLKQRPFTETRVYVSDDQSKYLHAGNLQKIESEAEYIQNLYRLGFPVPIILERGLINSEGYYIETSVGTESYATKFKNDYSERGIISPEIYASFCTRVCVFFDSQLKTSLAKTLQCDLEGMMKLPNVLEENPDLDIVQINNCIDKIKDRIKRLPAVYSHGDLTPRNIFEGGIIDFEFNSIGPVGLDVLVAPLVENLWAFKDGDRKTHEEFIINAEQVNFYFDMINLTAKKNGVDNFLEVIDDFVLVKAFWALAYEKKQAITSGNSLKWNFRKSILNYCMNQYLNNKRIDTLSFRHFGH